MIRHVDREIKNDHLTTKEKNGGKKKKTDLTADEVSNHTRVSHPSLGSR